MPDVKVYICAPNLQIIFSVIIFKSPKLETARTSLSSKMDKLYYNHYTAIKVKRLLLYTMTWMTFTIIMLGLRSQTEKRKYCLISFL